MSTRFEGAGAKDLRLSILKAGEEIGEDVVPEGQIALAFNYDEVFYIQGTVWDVGQLMQRAVDEIREHEHEQLHRRKKEKS